MPEMNPISLPPEIILLIIHRLDQRSLAQCILVCHVWHTLCEPSLWRSVKLTKTGNNSSPAFINALRRNLRHVRQLETSDPELVRYLALHQPPLDQFQSLGVKLDEEAPSFLQSVSLLSAPPHWTHLATRHGNAHVLTRLLTRCVNLQELGVGGRSCFNHADGTDAFLEIMASCPTASLKRLRIKFMRNNSTRCARRSPPDEMEDPDQEWLLTVEQQQGLLPFLALQEVAFLRSCLHIHPYRLAFLARCPNLRRIEINWPDKCLLEHLPNALHWCCPNVTELVWEGAHEDCDEELAAMIRSSRLGWRVLALPYVGEIGSSFLEALLEGMETWEEVRKQTWEIDPYWGHNVFLHLVCSARNLRHLGGPANENRDIWDSAVEVHAYDAFKEHFDKYDDDRTWALGPSMKYLQMQIVGVPRPDVICRDNGGPLVEWAYEAYLDGSHRYEVQRWIYEQLARMTGLEELILGMMDVSHEKFRSYTQDKCMESVSLADIEDLIEAKGSPCRLIIYQCLEFSMASGLEMLKGWKELRVLDVKSTAHRIGVEELEWMHVNWPKLKEVRGLVSERRWAGQCEDGRRVVKEVQAWMAVHPHGIGCSYYQTSA